MSYEHKIGNGSLFKNTNKTNENQPDYSGSIKLQDGKDQQIAVGLKKAQKGNFLVLNYPIHMLNRNQIRLKRRKIPTICHFNQPK